MHFKRTPRVLTAWIALCAILFGVLAPALTHALPLASQGKQHWVEVCTRGGMKHIAVDENGEPVRKHARHGDHAPTEHIQHCAFCATHGNTPVLPSTQSQPSAAATREHEAPSLRPQTPRLHFLWAAAQPRAPPVLS